MGWDTSAWKTERKTLCLRARIVDAVMVAAVGRGLWQSHPQLRHSPSRGDELLPFKTGCWSGRSPSPNAFPRPGVGCGLRDLAGARQTKQNKRRRRRGLRCVMCGADGVVGWKCQTIGVEPLQRVGGMRSRARPSPEGR